MLLLVCAKIRLVTYVLINTHCRTETCPNNHVEGHGRDVCCSQGASGFLAFGLLLPIFALTLFPNRLVHCHE